MSQPSPLVARLPKLVVHADWGVAPHKRWIAYALHTEDLGYLLHAAQPVGDPSTLLDRLRAMVGPQDTIFVGFDFPIGVPANYAATAGISRFLDWLPLLGAADWSEFFNVCRNREEISAYRPFYPHAPGGRRQTHLTEALGVADMHELLRECEHRTNDRGPASPLFWTLGAKQVGKGALTGWREVLAPALRAARQVAVWPFAGELRDLLSQPQIVVAETYPAEACLHVGMTAPSASTWSKRRQADRKVRGWELLKWSDRRELPTHANYMLQLSQGFGEGADGEDRFDAVVGLCSMLEVVLGHRADGAPTSDSVRRTEGWILGLHGGDLLRARNSRRASRTKP